MTQQEAGKKLRFSPSKMSRIEKGRCRITTSTWRCWTSTA
nr:helix-turn-helix transcriptional regulator [Amycolatopsis anabasis]